MPTHFVASDPLSLQVLEEVLRGERDIALSPEAIGKIKACRDYLDHKLDRTTGALYGINTGFGSLYNRNIPREQLEKLQENLVKSHACGTGAEVPEEIVRLMLVLKAQSLAYGYSGVQVDTVQRLVDMFNHHATPVVYEMGSLGASGDLAPLAHLTLPMIGEGEVTHQDTRFTGREILSRLNWEPIHLKAKEGLALLNGTQFMTAYGTWSLIHAYRLLELANIIAAISLDAFDGRVEPFHHLVHDIRPHNGQRNVAAKMLRLLDGSRLSAQAKKHVQDPYSFRCIPQVHGASADAIAHVAGIFLTEVNAVTDNPNVFPDHDLIVSAGNFHGQPLALGSDYLAIALSELASISERRTYQLISGARDLPNYLVANPGINSGLMIPQYTAASLVSQNKQLCTPASVDSIVSSNGQEDHVSMGANGASRLYKIVNNVYSVLAIEAITATQALEFRKPSKTSPVLEKWVSNFRAHVSFIETDRLLHNDIKASEKFLKEVKLES